MINDRSLRITTWNSCGGTIAPRDSRYYRRALVVARAPQPSKVRNALMRAIPRSRSADAPGVSRGGGTMERYPDAGQVRGISRSSLRPTDGPESFAKSDGFGSRAPSRDDVTASLTT